MLSAVSSIGPIHSGMRNRQDHLVSMTGNTERLSIVTILTIEHAFSYLYGMAVKETSPMGFWHGIITAVAFRTKALQMAVLAILLVPPCFIFMLNHKDWGGVGCWYQIAIKEILMAYIARNRCVLFVVTRKTKIHFRNINIW